MMLQVLCLPYHTLNVFTEAVDEWDADTALMQKVMTPKWKMSKS
jgi:hypothetical protein